MWKCVHMDFFFFNKCLKNKRERINRTLYIYIYIDRCEWISETPG